LVNGLKTLAVNFVHAAAFGPYGDKKAVLPSGEAKILSLIATAPVISHR